ncbi:MAG: hypothetical protein Q9157_005250 [Trypethelium eluteriae]
MITKERVTNIPIDCEHNWKEANQDFWCRYLGGSLAILLRHAGYSEEAQYGHWLFLNKVIAPNLGLSLHAQSRWKSFMTDDGGPVELSWEWPVGTETPKIRYSIEPIGPQAGTWLDPYNTSVLGPFNKFLLETLSETAMVWFNHFEKEFCPTQEHFLRMSSEDHSTHHFYAFDLEDDKTTAKAYFFPALRAQEAKMSTLDVICQAISRAPQWRLAGSQALVSFRNFATKPASAKLEFSMLAIDLVEPSLSRVKIYYRCRRTDFESVVHNLTLGERERAAALRQGLESLRALWDALFQVDSQSKTSLPYVNHQTAGILYYAELRPGSSMPSTKIYLPVRHYSVTDQHITTTLSSYFRTSVHHCAVQGYKKTMQSLL